MLLGTTGWERPEWLEGYYPADLPEEWRLAFYANDCGCVLLPASTWCGAGGARLGQALADEAGRLTLFLETPARGASAAGCDPGMLEANPVVLLVQRADDRFPDAAQWVAREPDVWADAATGEALVRWALARPADLRDLRARASALPQAVRALVLDGPGASPALVPELRVLLQLLGRG